MRKGPFAGLSWLQLIAGSLAAMTSAWVASHLGVAGTVIGAAVGSLVASVASAIYVSGLDRGRTLITESGSVVTRRREDDDGDEHAEVFVAEEGARERPGGRDFSWRRVLVWAVAGLVAALLAIGAWELATGTSFGRADEPVIGRPWQDRDPQPSPSGPSESPDADDPSPEPTTESSTSPTPTTGPTTAPAPTTAPPTESTAPPAAETSAPPDDAPPTD